MAKEDEVEDESEDGSDQQSSKEETSDTDEGEARCKPIFVRKKDRLTIQEREGEERRQRQLEKQAIKKAEMRRRESLRMVEACVKNTILEQKSNNNDPKGLLEANTDDNNEDLQ